MPGPFEEDEFFEDEWLDIYDMEGHKASVRHLATVHCNDNNYMILGTVREDDEQKGAFMLVREELTAAGTTEYVTVNNPSEA